MVFVPSPVATYSVVFISPVATFVLPVAKLSGVWWYGGDGGGVA